MLWNSHVSITGRCRIQPIWIPCLLLWDNFGMRNFCRNLLRVSALQKILRNLKSAKHNRFFALDYHYRNSWRKTLLLPCKFFLLHNPPTRNFLYKTRWFVDTRNDNCRNFNTLGLFQEIQNVIFKAHWFFFMRNSFSAKHREMGEFLQLRSFRLANQSTLETLYPHNS